jgi:DNA-binding transcriptional LysR family regulator
MNATFRQLKLFLALADSGSVTSAARSMHVTQPTASMQLKELSNSVGLPLYEVISKTVHLTPVGIELAKTARLMTNEWESFEQLTANMKGLKKGSLKIAVVSTAKYFIPKLLGSFCNKYPDVDIALEVLNRDGVIRRLEQNMDDMYIMSIPPSNIEIEDEVFMSNPLVMIADKNHLLSDVSSINLEDLKTQRFILREVGSGTRMATNLHFKKNGFKPNIRLELGSNEAIKKAVAGGLGLGVMSMHALDNNYIQNELSILDVKDFPIHSNWHIVTAKGKKLTPIAKIFHDHLISEDKKSWVV